MAAPAPLSMVRRESFMAMRRDLLSGLKRPARDDFPHQDGHPIPALLELPRQLVDDGTVALREAAPERVAQDLLGQRATETVGVVAEQRPELGDVGEAAAVGEGARRIDGRCMRVVGAELLTVLAGSPRADGVVVLEAETIAIDLAMARGAR